MQTKNALVQRQSKKLNDTNNYVYPKYPLQDEFHSPTLHSMLFPRLELNGLISSGFADRLAPLDSSGAETYSDRSIYNKLYLSVKRINIL